MLINIDLGHKYSVQKLYRMKRYTFDVLHIFAVKPLFFEINQICYQKNAKPH